MATPMRVDAPVVRRLALLRDGTALGCFALRQHETHAVVLEPNGHAYAYVGPSGRPSRHLTPTVLSAHRALVAALVRFRNQYAWCADRSCSQLPYVHSVLVSDVRRRAQRRRMAAVCWPKTESYATNALWSEHDGAFVFESMECDARVRLDASGRLVDVEYAVWVRSEREGEDSSMESWVQHTFPVACTPRCFAYAVRVLQQARVARASGRDRFQVTSYDRETFDATDELPGNSALDARPTFRPLCSKPGADDVVSVEAASRWIRGLSKSLDGSVAVEQQDDISLIVNTADNDPSRTVLIRAEERMEAEGIALIECDRGFLRSFNSRGDVVVQFTHETMPLDCNAFGFPIDRLRTFLMRAVTLCNCVATITHTDHIIHEAASMPSNDSPAVLEDVTTSDGRFRAFSDGRVRVVFDDRTILQVKDGHCSFTYRDGSTGSCTVDSASGDQQPYINAALDFAQWAFATPEQRFKRHQAQLEQRQLIAKELHKIAIRHELNRVDSQYNEALAFGDGSNAPTHEMSRESIAQLVQDTQWHLSHVRTLLKQDGETKRE